MATREIKGAENGDRISIHTTLAGGDQEMGLLYDLCIISIHTTLAGGDDATDDSGVVYVISIHTTLAGGDLRRIR